MKKFVRKTALFLLPLVIAAVGIEVLLRNIPNDYIEKRDYLDANSDNIELLVMGSSHAYYGINPAYFDRIAYNASYVSQSLDYDFEILKKYQNDLSSLKYIILPISSFSLFSRLETGDESWRAVNYNVYYGLKSGFSLNDQFEIFSNRFNVIANRIISYYIKNKSTITTDSLGWGIFEAHHNRISMLESGKVAAARHSVVPDEPGKMVDENLQILASFLRLCNEYNVSVLLVTPPGYTTYVRHLNEAQLNEMVKNVRKLVAEHDNAIYLNYLEDPYFDIDDFEDADHLSAAGAKKFSLLLNEVLLKKWKMK